VLTGTASWDPDAQTIHMVISTTERHKPRIGMLLVKAGILTEKQLGNALDVQERTGEKLGTILVNLGYMAEEALLDAVGSQLQVPFIRLEDETFDPAIAGFVGAHIARARRCIPVRREKDQIIMAMADPLDLATLNEVERLCKARVDIRIAPETAIMAAIDRVYGADTAQDP
jgi:hypothetical protein